MGLFCPPVDPSPHILACPRPPKRMRKQVIVFAPREIQVLHQGWPAGPFAALEIALAKSTQQQFALIEPRRMARSQEYPHPLTIGSQQVVRRRTGMAGTPIPNQMNALGPLEFGKQLF